MTQICGQRVVETTVAIRHSVKATFVHGIAINLKSPDKEMFEYSGVAYNSAAEPGFSESERYGKLNTSDASAAQVSEFLQGWGSFTGISEGVQEYALTRALDTGQTAVETGFGLPPDYSLSIGYIYGWPVNNNSTPIPGMLIVPPLPR